MSYATYSVPCPYCNVEAGYPCRTSTGRVAEPHKARRVEGFAALNVAAEEDAAVVVEAEDTVAPGDQVDTAVEDADRCSTCGQAAIIDVAATKARRAHAAADRDPGTLDPDALVLDTVQHRDGRVSLAAFKYHDGMTIESRVVNGRILDARLYDRDDQLRVSFYRASDFDVLNDVLIDAGVYEDDAPSIGFGGPGFGGPVPGGAPRAVGSISVPLIEAINGLNDTPIDPAVTGKYAPAGLHSRTAVDAALDTLVDDIEEAAVDAALDTLVDDIEEAAVVEDDVNPTPRPYDRGKARAVRTVQEYNADFGPTRAIMLTALAVKFAAADAEDDDTGYERGKVDGFGLALNVLDGYIG